LSWLDPAREFVLLFANAEKLKISGDYPEILTFLKNTCGEQGQIHQLEPLFTKSKVANYSENTPQTFRRAKRGGHS